MLKRAYSLLEVKEVTEEEDAYIVRGMATTPTPDRVNDIVEPLGATFAPQIPLLWQHNAEKPVGITELGKPTKKGIPFVSRIPKVKEPGILRDRIEEAVQSIRYKLVAAVSIGFRLLNDAIERLQNGGYRYLETEILELSLVTIPAQPDAKITGIKSIDDRLRAASGHKRSGVSLIKSSPASRDITPARKRGPVQLIPRKYDRGKEDSAGSDQGS
jgi:HK97 family phage prohead protease